MHDLVCPDRHLDEALAAMERFSKAPVRGLSLPELRRLLEKLGRLNSATTSALCRVTVEVDAEGPSAGAAGVLQNTTRMSKRDANRTAKTAKGLAEMPTVAGRLADGELTAEHVNALVDAAEQTSPEAVDSDRSLLDSASEKPADLFAQDAKRWVSDNADDRGEALLQRQRKARKLSMWLDRHTGMGCISGQFDPVRYGLLEEAIAGHAKLLQRQDSAGNHGIAGTADTPSGDPHEKRTFWQRQADAFFEIATQRDALSLQLLESIGTDETDTGTQRSQARKRQGIGGARGRASTQLVVVADIGLIDGTNPAGRCEIPGTGPVPPSILSQLSPDTKLAGMIFSGKGRVLWLGRSRRFVNLPQELAVAVRDRGCVKCGAPMHQCDIHHVLPWKQDGPTDIENLQALCRTHHRESHGPHDPDKRTPGRGSEQRPPPGHPAGRGSGDPLNGQLLL